MGEYPHNLARYDAWANERLIQTLVGAVANNERVLHLAGHLAAGKRVWLARVRGEDTHGWNLFPVFPVETFAAMLREADREMLALTASGAQDFDRLVHYRNQTGKYFDTKLSDICIHIVNHATYHRGQLATAVKQAGGEPAVTDYVAWIRNL